MDHEPDEIIVNILELVPDKIYVSMVCKRWTGLLNDMYVNNLIVNNNDPYYLKRQYDEKNIYMFENEICHITNYKCLNYVCFIVQKGYNNKHIYCRSFLNKLLLKNCDVKNISKPYDIKFLVKNMRLIITDVCTYIFEKKLYEMLQFITPYYDVITIWVFVNSKSRDVDDLIKEIDMLVEKDVDIYTNIHRVISQSNIFRCRKEIIDYLEEKIYNK